MKTNLYISSLALLALVACGTPSPSSDLPSEVVDEALSQPNRMLLNTMMAMATSNAVATETTLTTDVLFRQSVRETSETSQSLSTVLFNVEADARLKTNDLLGSAPQAELDVNIENFRFLQSASFMGQSYSNELVYDDQRLNILYDEGMMFVDLSGIQSMLSGLQLIDLETLKLKFPVQSPEELGLAPQEMTEADQQAFVDEWLPFVDTIPGLEATVSGSFLNIQYAITQEEFNQMVTDMFLEGTENLTLTSEETEFLQDMIDDTIALVTINKLEFALQLNLMTSQISSLLIDVDVELNDTYMYEYITDYDPENPEADEYGYLYETITGESLTVIDVFVQLSMEMFTESQPIAVLINKDEYTLVDVL